MRTLAKYLLHGLMLLLLAPTFAQDMAQPDNLTSAGTVRREYHTQKIQDQLIKLDGIHDEPEWLLVPIETGFTQHQPESGSQPYLQTEFRITHDSKYLYLAYRAYDTSPDSIVERLSRRDEFAGDWVEVNIDSYHDLRTAFSFTVSVSGVRGDEFVSNDGNHWDTNWNPVWDAATNIDSLGWTAELRIPFSQLRYGNQTEPVWGIQVMRRIFRKEERSTWQFVPQNSGGWVSQFGELHGLTDLPRNRQIEIAPYVSAQKEIFPEQPGNPFADGSSSKLSAGVDGKISVTRDMILDFTINPDFGQVEADPGAIRLDGYEVFFEERRPFFMENRNLFDYQITGSVAGGAYDSDLLFYSRRIGGAPHGYPATHPGEYVDIPDFTSIAGAAKFSGKTKNGLSIGILESITDKEKATVSNGEEEHEVLVEPLTNYFVGRLIKDFNKGNTILGGIMTAVHRKEGLDYIHQKAYSGSLDFTHYWKNRWWFFKVNTLFSHVSGTETAILNTQTAFVHLLQRKDADHLGVDPTRTSLTGTGGTIKIGKFGGKTNPQGSVIKFETGVTWRSPHLEINDIGFLLASDEINHFTWAAYQVNKAFSIFRTVQINYNHWGRWDFGGKFIYAEFNTNGHMHFKNNWRVGGGFSYNVHDISNNALRGTTSLRRPPGFGANAYVESDTRKKVSVYFNFFRGRGYQHTVSYFEISGGITYHPVNAFRISIGPGYSESYRKKDQFVTNLLYGEEDRSIVSHVDQSNFNISTRLNYYITPNLSIQYYGQPYIFRATYKDYGYVQDPLNKDYDSRFHTYTNEEITLQEGLASVDENGDGQSDYSFHTPDLNYIQFRSNLVLRWEYIAGSEFYLVWSQGIDPNAYDDLETPLLESLYNNVFDAEPHHIFLVKISYRFLN